MIPLFPLQEIVPWQTTFPSPLSAPSWHWIGPTKNTPSLSEKAATGERQSGFLDHTPEAVRGWAAELIARLGPAPIAVSLEQSHGPVVSMLLEFEQLVVYPLAPQTLATLRAAFYSSGSKDDPLDA